MATIVGGSGNDLLVGTQQNDLIKGKGGDDTLFGRGGDDRLYGGSSNDLLFGSRGDDVLKGGSERLTGALLDRLTHHVNILEMNGESYRLNQSRRRQTPTAN